MTSHEREAVASGRRWAEKKAASFAEAPISEWPSEWNSAWNGTLLDGAALDPRTRSALHALAAHAAFERWSELYVERRAREESRAEGRSV